MHQLSTWSKKCIWLIGINIAIICWLITISKTNITMLNPGDILGVVGRLPILFWISLCIALLCLIIATMQNNRIFSLLSIIILVFVLFATYPMIEQNGRHAVSYKVAYNEETLAGTYQSNVYHVSWLNYPYKAFIGFPALIESIRQISSLSNDLIIKFFPSCMVLGICTIVYSLYSFKSKNNVLVMIGLMFFIGSFYWHVYSVPQLLTYALVPTFLLILLHRNSEKKDNWAYSILGIITFFAIITIHILAPLTIIICLFFMYLVEWLTNKKERSIVSLFILTVCGLGTWLLYLSINFFQSALIAVFKSFSNFDSWFDSVTLGQFISITTLQKILANYFVLSPLVLLGILCMISLLIFILNNRNKLNNYYIYFCYLFAVFIIMIIPYGGDLSITRMASYFVLVASFIASLMFTEKKVIGLILASVFIMFHPFAYSGPSTLVSFISLSEIKGSNFFANKSDLDASYFYQSNVFVGYNNAYRAFRGNVYSLWYPPIRNFNKDWNMQYLLHSTSDHLRLYYYIGSDPVQSIIDDSKKVTEIIYSDGNFWVYFLPNGHL